jgi:hypothetical protein
MTTRRNRKSEDLSRGPGMTPIDNPEPDISDDSHEPNSTTGRLPSQDEDSDPTEKKQPTTRGTKRRAAKAGSR